MHVRFSKKFAKQHEKAEKKIKTAFDEKLELFLKNPYHPRLNNHQLTGRLKGSRSINITGDWRAIYSEYRNSNGDNTVVFELLGTHSQLYK